MSNSQAGLFGLRKTNRDFTQKEAWGKNQFNSSFPASLCCYLASKNEEAVYLSIQQGEFQQASISIHDLFGISPTDSDLYFAFESIHTPFQKYVTGSLPRTDLVIQRESTGECLTALEVKLTALPDNTTCDLNEDQYGSEIVVRPDTIVYLACSIAASVGMNLANLIPDLEIQDWSNPHQVLPHIEVILGTIENLVITIERQQMSFLLQPVWKTKGKSPKLTENCLDVFVWSNAGFSYFISKIANNDPTATKITRQTRTAIWLFKMLSDTKNFGRFDHAKIIDRLSYNTKNDKAFATAGNLTNSYMRCERLKKPKIKKAEIQKIILGGGQNLLSPERRFDAIIFNSPELFSKKKLKAIDLFSGCGGLSLGFQNAGIEILASVDNWKKAVDVYRANFQHPCYLHDVRDEKGCLDILNRYSLDMIIGGPPCQDFSSAGKRDTTLGRADLTYNFANIINLYKPNWFVMENVERIKKSHVLCDITQEFKRNGYGLTAVILDASYCNTPQARKRFFLIGELGGKNNAIIPFLYELLSSKQMTVRDYLDQSLGLEYYYRHPRNYSRRGLYSIDEPSPTVRGVNRPVPKGYQKHRADPKGADLSTVRPLTTIERSYIQTFPKSFKFSGTKTDLEQMIGNAVPVNLAEFVAKAILSYIARDRFSYMRQPGLLKQNNYFEIPTKPLHRMV